MATTTKQKALYVFIALGVALVAYGIYHFFFNDPCDPNHNGYTKKGKVSDKCKVADPKTTNTPPPSGTTQWVPDTTFPLKRGSWGSKVKAVQTKLGIPADGRFGSQTEGAVYAKFGKNELSEADYNSLINPPASGGGANYQQLKTKLGTLAKNFSGGITYNIQGQNKNYTFDFYTNGRFFLHEQGQNNILYSGTYSNGGNTMSIDSGKTYTEGGVFSNTIKIIKELGN